MPQVLMPQVLCIKQIPRPKVDNMLNDRDQIVMKVRVEKLEGDKSAKLIKSKSFLKLQRMERQEEEAAPSLWFSILVYGP